MMQSTEPWYGDDFIARACFRCAAASRNLLIQPKVSAIFVIQAINTTPILLNCDKFGMHGIRGTAAE
jgi:hypothetical protein